MTEKERMEKLVGEALGRAWTYAILEKPYMAHARLLREEEVGHKAGWILVKDEPVLVLPAPTSKLWVGVWASSARYLEYEPDDLANGTNHWWDMYNSDPFRLAVLAEVLADLEERNQLNEEADSDEAE